MTAQELCETGKLDEQIKTLAAAVLAIQTKIEDQIPLYAKMPLYQKVTVGTGEQILRQNPYLVEFRATVRDYAAALDSLRRALDDSEKEQAPVSQIEELRKKYKII